MKEGPGGGGASAERARRRRRMESRMKPARRRARTLLPVAMPAMAGVGRGWAGGVVSAGWGGVEGLGVGVVGGMRLAVVVRVMVEGGREVSVRVEVMVMVVSASRTLGVVSMDKGQGLVSRVCLPGGGFGTYRVLV